MVNDKSSIDENVAMRIKRITVAPKGGRRLNQSWQVLSCGGSFDGGEVFMSLDRSNGRRSRACHRAG